MILASTCERVAEPAVLPVTLEEMRAHCQIGDGVTDFDAMLDAAVAAATMTVEDETRRAIITQEWRAYLPVGCWSERDPVRLPRPRLQTVTSLEYRKPDKSWNPWSSFAVLSATEPALIWITAGAPADIDQPAHDEDPVWRATYSTGYGASPPAVPAPLRAALKLMAAHIFEHRDTVIVGQTVIEIPSTGIDCLIAPYRVPWGGAHL